MLHDNEEIMEREVWKPGTLIYPLPAVLVSCGATPEEYNMLTVAWTGTICSDPAMCYISVRPERHSYPIIKESGEFVINIDSIGESMPFKISNDSVGEAFYIHAK